MERIYLNRKWLFKLDNKQEEVDIPHTVKELPFNYFDENDYQVNATYIKEIHIDNKYIGKHLFLTFEGVAHKATIYVNEKEVLTHLGGYDAFKIDIKDYVKYGDNNLIKVEVDSHENLNVPPFGNVIDYLTYGGIYRDVYLDISEDIYVEDIFAKPYHKNDTWGVDVEVTLSKIIDFKIELIYQNNIIDSQEVFPVNKVNEINFEVKDPHLWDIDDPSLYQLKVILNNNEYKQIRFGLRTVEFKVDGFYLNGNRIKIRGLNRHQSYPYVGYAMPKSMQVEDARILKEELMVNAVRTSHYPQSQYFIDACDEMGLLVFTEIPGWQHIGNESWKALAITNAINMVKQYRNHPSIILWGARINESVDDHDFYTKTNQVIHELDPTRQTGGVRCYKKGEVLEDVYTFNDFIDPRDKSGVTKKTKVTRKDVPYLISEFNGHMYPTKPFDNEDRRTNQMLRIARGLNDFYKSKDICGMFVWCMFDYNTHKDFGSGDKICYHGVTDMFRNPKISAYLYASQGDKPTMEISGHYNQGEHDAALLNGFYVLTNADYINLYKGDELINTFTYKDSPYLNLPHPPIHVDDLIGDQLQKKEGYSKKDADRMKFILKDLLNNGSHLSFRSILKALKLIIFNHFNFNKGYALYVKYLGGWGVKESSYSIEGVKDGLPFKKISLERFKKAHIEAKISSTTLKEDHTYDVASIRLRMLDQANKEMPYYNEGATLTTSGPIEIIGPNIISFKGGCSATYIRSKGKGKASVTITTQSMEKQIDFICE